MPDPTVPLAADDLRQHLADALTELVKDHGVDVREWADDEIEFMRHGDWHDFSDRGEKLWAIRRRKVANAVIDLMASLADTDRDGLASLLRTVECFGNRYPKAFVDAERVEVLASEIRAAEADVERLTPPRGWFLDRDGHGTRALWLDHPDSPDDPWPRMLAAESGGQEPLWDWMATIVPTRTQETPDA